MKRIMALVSLAGLSLITSCGDNEVECGDGTHVEEGRCVPDGTSITCGDGTFEYMDECVPYDPTDSVAPTTTASPAGGVYVELPKFVVLSSDETAEIHWTTDGSEPTTNSPSELSPVFIFDIEADSELKFFAIDPAGNMETVRTEVYELDVVGPSAVRNLAASDDGTEVDLSWTNPIDADLAGVLVVRSVGTVGQFEPEQGVLYDSGDVVSAGEQVLFAGNATSAVDDSAVVGFNAYHVWTFDEAGNYSPRRLTSAIRQAPDQTGTLSIALGNPATVTVSTQPPHIQLSGSATYDDGANTITLNLGIENQIARAIHNPKVVIDDIDGGAIGNPDGQLDGNNYIYFGPESLAPMSVHSRTITITGVDGSTDPVTLDVTVRNDPMIVTSTHFSPNRAGILVDHATKKQVGRIACDEYTFPLQDHSRNTGFHNYCAWRDGILSPSARYAYIGSRHNTVVRAVDLTALGTVSALDLGSFGFVETVRRGADYLYALYSSASHAYVVGFGGGANQIGGDVFLVRIDARGAELREVDRLEVWSDIAPDGQIAGRRMAISPDGSMAAIPMMGAGQVVLVDLGSFEVIDTDNATPGVQNLDVSGIGTYPKLAVFSPDSQTLYVGYSNADDTSTITTVQLSDYSLGSLPTTLSAASGTADMELAPDGSLWVARIGVGNGNGNAVSVYNLMGPTETVLSVDDTPANPGGSTRKYADGIGFSGDGATAYVPFFVTNSVDDSQIAVFDTAGPTRVDTDGNTGNGVTNIGLDTPPGGHVVLVTPF